MSDDFLNEPLPVAHTDDTPAAPAAAAPAAAAVTPAPAPQQQQPQPQQQAPQQPVAATRSPQAAHQQPAKPALIHPSSSAASAAPVPAAAVATAAAAGLPAPAAASPKHPLINMADLCVTVTGTTSGMDALTSQIVTLYVINITLPQFNLDWTVQRRFSEFDSLHQVLSEHTTALPSLPAKTWWFRNMSDELIAKRRQELDVFMKKLVTIPHARHSRELINFLSVLDHAVPDTSRVPVPFATITDRNFGVNDVVYSPADGLVITACEDADLISRLDSQLSNIPLPWEAKSKASSVVPLGSLNCWQLDTESGSYLPVSTLFYEHQVTSVAWDPVRRYIFAGMENGKTIIYYASPGFAELTVVVELAHHTKKVAKMAYVQAHGDDLLVSIGRDSLLVVYSLRSERITSQANMLEGWLACLQVDAANDYVYVGTFSGKVLIYDISTPTASYVHMLLGHNGAVRALDFNHKSGYLISGGFDYRAAIWQTASGKDAKRITNAGWMINGPAQKIKAVALLPELSMLCTGLDNGTIALWDTSTGDMIYVLNGHKNSVVWMEWRPERNMLITAARDGKVRFWSMGSGSPLAALPTAATTAAGTGDAARGAAPAAMVNSAAAAARI